MEKMKNLDTALMADMVLREALLDYCYKYGNKDMFMKLTSEDWREYVVSNKEYFLLMVYDPETDTRKPKAVLIDLGSKVGKESLVDNGKS